MYFARWPDWPLIGGQLQISVQIDIGLEVSSVAGLDLISHYTRRFICCQAEHRPPELNRYPGYFLLPTPMINLSCHRATGFLSIQQLSSYQTLPFHSIQRPLFSLSGLYWNDGQIFGTMRWYIEDDGSFLVLCFSDKDLCNFKTIRWKWTFWSSIASLTICGYLRL